MTDNSRMLEKPVSKARGNEAAGAYFLSEKAATEDVADGTFQDSVNFDKLPFMDQLSEDPVARQAI